MGIDVLNLALKKMMTQRQDGYRTYKSVTANRKVLLILCKVFLFLSAVTLFELTVVNNWMIIMVRTHVV